MLFDFILNNIFNLKQYDNIIIGAPHCYIKIKRPIYIFFYVDYMVPL